MQIANRESFAAAARSRGKMVRIAYIEGSGTQFIDTDFLPKAGDVISGYFYAKTGKASGFFGTCSSDFSNAWGIFRTSTNYYGYMRRNYGIQGITQISAQGMTYVEQTQTNYTMFGFTQKYSFGYSADRDASLPLCVMAIRSPSASGGYSMIGDELRCYGLTVQRSGVAVAEYVPVRVGREGGLYDLVSGKFFGNTGTGSFTVGPDKT